MDKKKVYDINKKWWERMVEEGCGYTRPWLDLDPATIQNYAKGLLENTPSPLDEYIYSASVLVNIKGIDVLCLASGGGQQSAIFGILGAQVTVVDIAEGQLEADKKAAEHYGYNVTTIQSDMGDLSFLGDNSFDLVYQAASISYIPDVQSLYREVARIVRSGGLFRADAYNPVSQFIDDDSWDGKGYRISVPYSVKEQKRSENEDVMEFRHYLSDIFNSLIDNEFIIEKVIEEPAEDLSQKENIQPGTYSHLLLYAPGHFAILARKK